MSNKKHGTRYNTSSYIDKARAVHQDKFDYSKLVYSSSHNKVKIICPTHGEFEQRACDHIHQKQGCPKCSHNFAYTHDEFVLSSKKKFGDKFEIIGKYLGMKHPITIKCKEHAIFETTAEAHLTGHGRCPACWYNGRLLNLKPGNISKIESKWLDSLSVPVRQHKLTMGNQTFLVDGFDPITNTVYECYGSFWHGDPAKYNPSDTNTKVGKTFGQLYKDTVERENIIKQKYNLITIWV